MTREEKEIIVYCLKANSNLHGEVCEECKNFPKCDHFQADSLMEKLIEALEQEQKIGHWILTDDDIFVYCSECEDSYYKRPIDASWHYCPNCGAKMVEPMESEE